MQNINAVSLTGNLTKDPELRATTGGTDVASLRVACNGRRKNSSGDWVDKPNYFDVTVFGGQARACGQYLSKGNPIAVSGRLDWREWETKDGNKRQAVQIIAENIQFLPTGQRRNDNGDDTPAAATEQPEETFKESPKDDIPF